MAISNSDHLGELQCASSYWQKAPVRYAGDAWDPVPLLYSPMDAFLLDGRLFQDGVGGCNDQSQYSIQVLGGSG